MSGSNSDKQSLVKRVWTNFSAKVPFLKKKVPAWTNGDDDIPKDENAGGGVIYLIMAVLGFVEGFFGCQYGKYLHQRYNCRAWGIPLCSTPVKSYGVTTIVLDVVVILLLGLFLFMVLALVNALMRLVFKERLELCTEICDTGLMIGVLMLILAVIIMLFIPFNLFLIGVPPAAGY